MSSLLPPSPPPRGDAQASAPTPADASLAEPGTERDQAWLTELDRWLAPFIEVLGDVRRHWQLSAYVHGLVSPSERKSLAPMATHLATYDATAAQTRYHHLQQFITNSTWDIAPLARVLAQRADQLLGGPDAVLLVDDTTLRKQGTHSVGVAHQYCGEIGKLATCQCLVSLTLAKDEVPLPLVLKLYLPPEWTADPARCAAAGVPEAERAPTTKPALALAELTRLKEAGVRFGLVAADAAYGTRAAFRHGVSALGLRYAVGVQSHARVYPADSTITYPPRPVHERERPPRHVYAHARRRTQSTPASPTHYSTGRLRVLPVASEPSQSVAELLRGADWQTVRWREGTKGHLHARWTALRVRVADGEEGRRGEHMPGELVWLVGEQRPNGLRRYYLTNHPARTALQALVRAIRSRWVCEQAHLQLKQELGLDHFEGRSWRGLEHHAFLTLLSFAFLQHLRLLESRRGGKKTCPAPPGPAAVTVTPAGPACPHCGTLLGDPHLSHVPDADPVPPVLHEITH